MPSQMAFLENSRPMFTGNETLQDQMDAMQGYVYQLVEQLGYVLRNLDPTKNMNTSARQDWENSITDPINLRIEDDEGHIAQLQLDAKELQLDMYGPDGHSGVKFDSNRIKVDFYGKDGTGKSACYKATIDGLYIDINGEGGLQRSGLKFDVKGLQVEIYGEDGSSGLKFDSNKIMVDFYGQDGSGKYACYKATIDGLYVDINGPDGQQKSGLKFDVNGLQTEIYGPDGISGLKFDSTKIMLDFYGKDGTGKYACYKATIDGLDVDINGPNGDGRSGLKFDVNGLRTEIYGPDGSGKYSGLIVSLNEVRTELYGTAPYYTGIVAKLGSLTQTVMGPDGQSGLVMQAGKINWLVESGTSIGSFTMTSQAAYAIFDKITWSTTPSTDGKSSQVYMTANGIRLSGPNIKFDGMVTFSNLAENSGKTFINGANIDTGNLNLTGKISFSSLNKEMQDKLNNYVDVSKVTTLITEAFVLSPTIIGASMEWYDPRYSSRIVGRIYGTEGNDGQGITQVIQMEAYSGYGIRITSARGVALTSKRLFMESDTVNFTTEASSIFVQDGGSSINLINLIKKYAGS